jgi:hypothetical protein
MVSINMAARAEYPKKPCTVKGEFLEPAIINAVAVISRIMPMVRVVRINGVNILRRCSDHTAME